MKPYFSLAFLRGNLSLCLPPTPLLSLPPPPPPPPIATQVFSLAGSTFSLPSSHIFGSPLTSGLSINPLLNQSESSRAGT